MELRRIDTDILILGAGGAGLFAALHAKKTAPSLDVTVTSPPWACTGAAMQAK